jgi:hypothetical protein
VKIKTALVSGGNCGNSKNWGTEAQAPQEN